MLLLTKGQGLNLTKGNAGLTKVNFALGWQGDADLDAFAIGIVGKSLVADEDVLYYNSNKMEKPEGSGRFVWIDNTLRQPYIWGKALVHSGDILTGDDTGDIEVITADLTKIPPYIDHVAFCVDIHEAKLRRHNFSMVQDAYIRLDDANATKDKTLAQFNLGKNAGYETGAVLGALARVDGEWAWKTTGEGFSGDINQFLTNIHKLIGIKL